MLDCVLVSGGSRGIGAETVRMLAAYGKRVAFTYCEAHNDAKKLSENTGAFAVCADMSSSAEAAAAVSYAHDKLGGLDVLINNAGISQIELFTDITDADWDNMLATNLSSVFYATRAALPYMISKKCGRIINVSSVWGVYGASCEAHYSTSKAGIIGLTKSLAKEVAPSGITVNCIAPGMIDTSMNSGFSNDELEQIIREIPVGRIGTVTDVAHAIRFLASEYAEYITGQVLGVDGGYGA